MQAAESGIGRRILKQRHVTDAAADLHQGIVVSPKRRAPEEEDAGRAGERQEDNKRQGNAAESSLARGAGRSLTPGDGVSGVHREKSAEGATLEPLSAFG